MQPEEILCTYTSDNPDFDEADEQADLEQMVQRNDAVIQLIEGSISGDDLLGIVDESGVDADVFFERSLHNLQVATHYLYLGVSPSGLLLPI